MVIDKVEERTNGKMIGREALPIGGILQDGVDRLLHQSPPRREVQHHLKNKVLSIVSIHSDVSEGVVRTLRRSVSARPLPHWISSSRRTCASSSQTTFAP